MCSWSLSLFNKTKPLPFFIKCPISSGPVAAEGGDEFFAPHSQILKDNNERAGNLVSFARNY